MLNAFLKKSKSKNKKNTEVRICTIWCLLAYSYLKTKSVFLTSSNVNHFYSKFLKMEGINFEIGLQFKDIPIREKVFNVSK